MWKYCFIIYLAGLRKITNNRFVCLQAEIGATHYLLDTKIECCSPQPPAVSCHGQSVAAFLVYNESVYLLSNIEAHSADRLCTGNTTMHFVCIVELSVTVGYIKILPVAQQCFCAK